MLVVVEIVNGSFTPKTHAHKSFTSMLPRYKKLSQSNTVNGVGAERE